jgi:hypothetical protein
MKWVIVNMICVNNNNGDKYLPKHQTSAFEE